MTDLTVGSLRFVIPIAVAGALWTTGCSPSPEGGHGSGGAPLDAGASGSGGTGSGGKSSGSGGASSGSGGSANGSGGTSGNNSGEGTGGSVSASGGTTAGTGGSASASGGAAGGMSGGTGGRGAGAEPATGGSNNGGAGTGGDGAGGGTTTCSFTATSAISTAIPTVATVSWTTSAALADIRSAEIDYGVTGGTTLVAPVALDSGPTFKTMLLGMKGGKAYTYNIIVETTAGTCASQAFSVMTGAVPGSVPKPTVSIGMPTAHDKGFVILSGGTTGSNTVIVDADGDVVWWATGPDQNSRSHLSWDGTHMYMMSLNVQNSSAGKIVSLGMDGTGSATVPGMVASHHDMVSIPTGFATLLWNKAGMDAPCSLVEVADGTWATKIVVADMSSVYTSNTFHTNAIHYYPKDDSYTVGDRNPNLYVKLTRAGSLVWQFGGSNPKDATKQFSGVTAWQVNHGHHLLADGTFLFFNNNANEAWGYKLNTTNMTASKTWSYTASGATSSVLGDVQGLPNGNMLVTFSTSGQIHEVSPSGGLVMKMTVTGGVGYSEFRESLYGPPLY